MRLILTSLKYSIGLEKEIQAIIDKSIENGVETFFWGDSRYNITNRINFFKLFKGFFLKKNTIYFYNFHIYQPFFLILFKLLGNQIVIMLHEPYKSIKELTKYGFIQGFIYTIVLYVQKQTLFIVDYIFTPSKYAYKLTRQSIPSRLHYKIIETRILLKKSKTKNYHKKKYLSIIGKLNPDKNLIPIINYINQLIRGNIYNKNIKFAVITSSNILPYIKSLLPGWQNYLLIVNQKKLKDSVINKYINSSYAVLCTHSVASQSGVLALAYMHGVPVIAKNIPAFNQFMLKNGGPLLVKDFTIKNLKKAINYVIINNDLLKKQCLNLSTQNFDIQNFSYFYRKLLKIL